MLAEALECQGGFGYIEESRLARAYREAPLMSIWEGSGNVQALDVLRALRPRARRRSTRCSTSSALAARRRPRASTRRSPQLAPASASAEPSEAQARALAGLLARACRRSLLVAPRPARRWPTPSAPTRLARAAGARVRRAAAAAPTPRRSSSARRPGVGARGMKVVAIQPRVALGEVERNLAHLEDLIDQAAREHSPEAIFLPEA